jgi:hypothetical protein
MCASGLPATPRAGSRPRSTRARVRASSRR